MKSFKCRKCGIETNQKDGICALCETGITRIYDELNGLLNKDSKPRTMLTHVAGSGHSGMVRGKDKKKLNQLKELNRNNSNSNRRKRFLFS